MNRSLFGLLTVLAAGSVLVAGCEQKRTQIVVRVRTDMTQGPAGELGSIALRVFGEGAAEAYHDEVYELGNVGSAILLPTEIGLIPDERRDGTVRVEVDARAPDGSVIFTKRAQARYVPGATLLLDMVLSARCLAADARTCPSGESCGVTGCEPDIRDSLPPYGDGDGGVVQRGDMGPVVCTALCDGECVDTNNDPSHCGGCGEVCPSPTGGEATCSAGSCGASCSADDHLCDTTCVSRFAVESCGGACEPCPAPSANGQASCDGTACGFVCDPGFQIEGDGCAPGPNVEPPRPVWPPNLARVSSLRPTFRWRNSSGVEGAYLQICRDPECTDVEASEPVVGESHRLQVELTASSGSRRRWFRLFGRRTGATGATPSVVWSFTLPAVDHDEDTAYGATNDLDGDGLADLAVGSTADTVRILLGQQGGAPQLAAGSLSQTSGAEFGSSVAAAGDVDGDGFGDLMVGAPGIRRAYLYRGGPAGLTTSPLTFVGPADSGFGRVVAGLGDVNGDGYADVAVGAPDAGTVTVYLGSAAPDATADVTIQGDASSELGTAVAGLGDLDGDGFAEMAVSATGAGEVLLYRGAASLSGTRTPAEASQRIAGAAVAGFGASLAGGADVDGDGRADLLVGAPGAAAGTAAVTLHLGRADGTVASEPAQGWVAPAGVDLGRTLVGLGDVDQDGFDDWMSGGPSGSTALLVRGGVDGGTPEPAATYAPVGQSGFGAALAGPGDLDGDGSADAAVGAPGSRSFTFYRHRGDAIDRAGTIVTQSDTAGHGAALACTEPMTKATENEERPT